MGKFYKIAIPIFTPLLSLIFPTKIVGKKLIERGKCISVCNHMSAMDPVVLAYKAYRKDFHAVSKAELFSEKHKLRNKLLRAIGAIPISRGETDLVAFKEILGLLSSGKQVCFFPEGTRKRDDSVALLPLKKGVATFAVRTKTPIQPFILLKKTSLFRKNYLFVGEAFTLEQFYRDKSSDAMGLATEYITQKMLELMEDARRYMVDKRSVKKWL